MKGHVLNGPDDALLFQAPNGEVYPLMTDERIPRDKLVRIRGEVWAHPFMVIELVCGDDLTARAKTNLLWIQQQIDEQAAAAIRRLERMFEPEDYMERRWRRVRENLQRAIARSRENLRLQAERQARLEAEEDYWFPATTGAAP